MDGCPGVSCEAARGRKRRREAFLEGVFAQVRIAENKEKDAPRST
jgi:hypothetical protein